MTALDALSARSADASRAAHARRAEAATPQEARKVCMKSYREGEAIAYSDARKIMEAELRRLCNAFQNGHLTISDFGIVL